MPRPQPEVPVIKKAKNYLTINKIDLAGTPLGRDPTGDWDHRRGAAVRPHAIRQTAMDRANAQINRLEAVEGSGERLTHDVVKRFSYAARVCRTCSGSAFIMRK